MPWRLALGNKTKAKARFEALLRVMEWLSSMKDAPRLAGRRRLGFGGSVGFVGTRRREAAGFAQRRVAAPVVRVFGPALASAPPAGGAPRWVAVPVGPLHDQGAAGVLGPFADEKGPEEQD